MTKRPQQQPDVEINLTGMREQIVRQFFEAIRPLVRAFDDIDAAERILGTGQIAAHAIAEISSNGHGNGNGRRPPAADNLKEKLEAAIPLVVEAGTRQTAAIHAALPQPLNRVHTSTFQSAMRNLLSQGKLKRTGLGFYAIGDGNGAPAKTRKKKKHPLQNGQGFIQYVQAAVADAPPKEGMSSADVVEKVQEAGYRFPPSKYTPGTVTSWALQGLLGKGKVRRIGSGRDRRFVPVLPKIQVTKG